MKATDRQQKQEEHSEGDYGRGLTYNSQLTGDWQVFMKCSMGPEQEVWCIPSTNLLSLRGRGRGTRAH
jgi:hypothetical protein